MLPQLPQTLPVFYEFHIYQKHEQEIIRNFFIFKEGTFLFPKQRRQSRQGFLLALYGNSPARLLIQNEAE